jgi:hypothetical protein
MTGMTGMTGAAEDSSPSHAAGASAEGVIVARVSVVVPTATAGAAVPAHPVIAEIMIAEVEAIASASFMCGTRYHQIESAQLDAVTRK